MTVGTAAREAALKDSTDSFRQLLFVVAILASAFLIFLVQPMVGKRILPWFGGVPSVWTVCLAFYQTTLFFGYAYAHLLIRFATPKNQLIIHGLLVSAALLALPVLPGDTWKPMDVTHPSLYIFQMLSSNVALPFLVLASTGPLVQAWFARSYPERSPYALYAVSNIGSFAALLAYPFLLEPRFSLPATATIWSIAFLATTAAVLCCAFVARAERPIAQTLKSEGVESDFGGDVLEKLDIAHVAMWCLLSGCAVVLLMGATNSVCLDTASVPFLWIMPLGIYLLTFILCFASERVYHPLPYMLITLVSLVPTMGLPVLEDLGFVRMGSFTHSVYVQIPAYCALVFGGCMVMHGELYRLRPDPRSLTIFYMCVSGGGALGGLAVGLLAPVLFDGYYELRVGVVLAAALSLAAAALAAKSSARSRVLGWHWYTIAPLTVMLLAYLLWPSGDASQNVVFQVRSFFGVLRVEEYPNQAAPQRHLLSGTTLHGVQMTRPKGRRMPTTYYGRATGVGLALSARANGRSMHVGVIGLGIGTLAAFGQPGDSFRFYEVDPEVASIARDPRFFTYLSDTAADVEIVIGDARLAIEDEQTQYGSQNFDYLIVDAFSSDAIPIHLITIEAFRLYANALVPGGVMAVHVSNRHFDLMPLVARAGFETGLHTLYVRTASSPRRQSQPSNWVLMSADSSRLTALDRDMKKRIDSMRLSPNFLKLSRPNEAEMRDVKFWTDDYSDLFGALRPKWSS